MLFKIIFFLGQKLRNPSINKWMIFLKKSDKFSLEELEVYQLKQFKELLSFAKLNSVFYQDLYSDIDVDKIISLKDLEKLPVITKKDLIENTQKIHTKNNFSKLFKATTSGSTGESLVFDREESADSFNRASIFRGYSWYDVSPWELNGYFWGFNFSKKEKLKTQLLDLLQNRFRLFTYEEESFKGFVRKLKKSSYLHGYSSMIYQTAKLINQQGKSVDFKIKMVKGTSEKIFDKYQDEVQKAFGQKMISEYGATESGIIAFECPKGNMHINMEGVIVEEIENEIVVTNLQMKSFPIIRYKLGDYISLADKQTTCSCGRQHRILEEVTGRIGENVEGFKGVYPSLYFYYIFKNLVKKIDLKLNYQILQEEKGILIFNIEQCLSKVEEQALKIEIEKYFDHDITYFINSEQKLISDNKKFKSFISKIN